jgi:hypothetical protein
MRAEHYQPASLKVRVPRGYQGFWDIMRALAASQGAFTITDIDGESNVARDEIGWYVRKCARAGFLKVERPGRSAGGQHPTLYSLAVTQKAAPRFRRDGSLIPATAQEQLWTAARGLASFGLRELMFAATTPETRPTYSATKVFVHRLARAGYLVSLPRPGSRAWRLKPGMNTGPRPPERRRLRADVLWDPNLKAFVGEPPVAKEVAP